MGNVIMVTSCKGGVGKTTLTAGISIALSRMGQRVVAVDMDFGVRSLDLALGLENSISCNAYELLCDKCKLSDAAVSDARAAEFSFIAAPSGFEASNLYKITTSQMTNFILKLKSEFDFVFLDMPAGFGRMFELVASSTAVDNAIVVSSHSPSAVRAAEKTALELYKVGQENPRLIINMFNLDFAKKGIYPGIIEIIERSSIKLIGVVPFDRNIDQIQQRGGLLACEEVKGSGNTATQNIAQRLNDENVPLMQNIMSIKNREKLL